MTDRDKKFGSTPMLGKNSPTLNYLAYKDTFAAKANSLSKRFNVLVSAVPPPLDPVDIANYAAGNMTAHQRRLHEKRVEDVEDYAGTEKEASALLLQGVTQNSSACSVLSLQRRGFLPVLPVGENPPVREMLAALDAHFDRHSSNIANSLDKTAKEIKIERGEPTPEFWIRLDQAISDVERQGRIYSLAEKMAMLENALDNGETHLEFYSSTLQLAGAAMTWAQVKEHVTAFNATPLGAKRLKPAKVKQTYLQALTEGSRSDDDEVFGIADKACIYCHKMGHRESDCWSKHPERMPEKFKRMNQQRKRARAKQDNSIPENKKIKREQFKFELDVCTVLQYRYSVL